MLIFDTLAYSDKLQAVGFTKDQAKIQAEELKSVLDENVATKSDIMALQRDIKELESRLGSKIEHSLKEVELRLETKIEQSKNDIIKWVAGLLVAQMITLIGLFSTLLRFLEK